MRSETTRIGLACFAGAFIGALISLQFASMLTWGKYFWIAGAALGGLAAYLAYDLQAVGRAVAVAWRKMTVVDLSWREVRKSAVWFLAGSGSVLLALWPMSLLAMNILGPWSPSWALLLGTIFWMPAFWVGMAKMVSVPNPPNVARVSLEMFLKYTNPLAMAYWYVRWTVQGLRWTGRFIRQVFIQVHRSERLLCLTDAAIGASIGYFAGSAFFGAVVGGLLGVLNYELVSVRWLKLVPERNAG